MHHANVPFTLDPFYCSDPRALGARHREIEAERRRLRVARREVDAAIVEQLARRLGDSIEAATTFASTVLELSRPVARRRIGAALAIHRNPMLLHHLRNGGVSLTALSILGIHAAVPELAEAAVGRSCAEVQDLVDSYHQRCKPDTESPSCVVITDAETVGVNPLDPATVCATASDSTLECELIEFAVHRGARTGPAPRSPSRDDPGSADFPQVQSQRAKATPGFAATRRGEFDPVSSILDRIGVRQSEPEVMRMIRVESMLFWLPVDADDPTSMMPFV